MPEHKYQLCQNQEVDGAATTLINLSMALQKSGRRRRGRQRLGCRHAGCHVIPMVSRWCSAEDVVWLQSFSYLLEVLEDAHMSGKTKKQYNKNCFYKYPQAGLKFIVQDAKGMLHGTEKSAVLGKLFVSWLAVTLHAAWWIGTGKEKARYSERYTEANNIYMQHVLCVMEYWLSVQMGKFMCVGAHNRSESASSLAM